MTPCYALEITTPKRFRLRGLWFGPRRAKNVIIFIHGLGGSVFSMRTVVAKLVNKNTAVLAFNNRGHDVISTLKHDKRKNLPPAGAAHERFVDCVDDIQGAVNFARRQKAKNVFLAGHSTGCQKSVYWAHKKNSRGVKGVILLAPVSDWAAELQLTGKRRLEAAAKIARSLVRRGKKHALLSTQKPLGIWIKTIDAQRFLSLYSPDSVEEVFSYTQPKKDPRALKSIAKPVLVLWPEKDEFSAKESLKDIKGWFEKYLRRGRVVVVPRVGHGFKGGEAKVVREIRRFVEAHS